MRLATLLLTGAALAVAAPLTPSATAGASTPRVAPVQVLVILQGPHAVRASPRIGAPRIAVVVSRRPATGARTTLPRIGNPRRADGRTWLRVRLPGRVIGGDASPPASGWIIAAKTRRTTTPWHLVVHLAQRRVSVYRDGRRVRRFAAIVGAPETPTPPGRYFIEENVQLPLGSIGGPFALATSARSSVLQEFAGGPGQIALHGLDNIGGELGTAASHGCVRLANGSISWLAARLPPGVPVTIVQ